MLAIRSVPGFELLFKPSFTAGLLGFGVAHPPGDAVAGKSTL